MKKANVNVKKSLERTSEKIRKKAVPKQKRTSFKIQKLDKHPYGYKYNVQVLNDGVYAGQGRFCKTMNEVNKYKKNMKSDPAKPVTKKGKTK